MKFYLLPLLLFVTILSSCNGQSSAYKKAKETEKAIKDAPRPGTEPTTNGGWTMTAKMNGEPWKATSIMHPAGSSRIIGYPGEKGYIGLPSFEKRYAKVGKKEKIGEGNAVDIWISGDETLYLEQSGNMEITKMNGDWVEGTFNFIITSKDGSKKVVVTDGFFRVQL